MSADLDELEDQALVARAQAGDERAFAEIYDRHVGGVVRSLASFAGTDRDLLDDLTQEVFFRVINNLESYRPFRPFTHWLYTISLNVGRNCVRDRSRVVRLDDSAAENSGGGTVEQYEDVLADTLMRLVSRLPEKMRDVVSLRIGGDLSYGEIADVLKIPEGTARSRMSAAINMLRAEAGGGEPERRKENGK